MEYKHFSHRHGLILHQVPQGSEISCSGCNFPGTGSIYVCWECRFFLHEQCFNAGRAMNLPSHPPHPLTLAPYPTYPSNSFYCNSCSLVGTGFSYSCSSCEFDIHIHCAYMPNKITHQPHNYNPFQNPTFPNEKPSSSSHFNEVVQTPSPPVGYPINNSPNKDQTMTQGIKHFSHSDPLLICRVQEQDSTICSCCEQDIVAGLAYSCAKLNCNFYLHKSCFDLPCDIRHKSHPKHPLKLLPCSPYKNGEFTCNACYGNGKGFTYHCLVCKYDLHVDCASLPETVKREDHKHPLRILYMSPIIYLNIQQEGMTFSCDVCKENIHDSCWVYYCQECDFGTHLGCVTSVANHGGGESSDKSVLDAQLQLQRLKLEMQKAHQEAQFFAGVAQSMAAMGNIG